MSAVSQALHPRQAVQQLERFQFYTRELALCARMAGDARSAVALAANTLRFHLMNLRGKASSGHLVDEPVEYRLKLGTSVQPVWLRSYAGDLFIFHEVFGTHCYDVSPRFIKKPRVVVDLGANVGLTTLYLRRAFGSATYVCVEPSPANFALLDKNVGGLNDVHLVRGAVSDQPGTARFNPGTWSWGGQLEDGSSAAYDVRCYSMDEILQAAGIDHVDLLKVDIENGVARLFGKNNDWLSRVDVVIAELYDGYSLQRFADDLDGFGLAVLPPGDEYGNKMALGVRKELLQLG